MENLKTLLTEAKAKVSLKRLLGRKYALTCLNNLMKELEKQRDRYKSHYESDPKRTEPITANQSYGAWEGVQMAIYKTKKAIQYLSP